VCYDQQTPTGHGQIRARYFEKYNSKIDLKTPVKMFSINKWKYENSGKTIEEKAKFLTNLFD